jgi:hypothetical protein
MGKYKTLRLKGTKYKECMNVHRKFKFFEVGDVMMVHLRKKHYPKHAYSKLNVRKIAPC